MKEKRRPRKVKCEAKARGQRPNVVHGGEGGRMGMGGRLCSYVIRMRH